MRKLRWAMVLTLSLTATQTCALFYPRWERADEFVIGLKCGMSSTEIETYARQFAGCTTFAPDGSDLPTLVVQHGGTNINCFLEDAKLRAVQVTWISKPATRKTDEARFQMAVSSRSLITPPSAHDKPRAGPARRLRKQAA